MSTISESWHSIAHTLGYDNEEEMLKDLYLKQSFSIGDLVKKLGYSQGNVRRRLLHYNIPLRAKGGSNRQGTGLLDVIPIEELRDPKKVIATYGVHSSSVYKAQIRRGLKKAKGGEQDGLRDDSTSVIPEEG